MLALSTQHLGLLSESRTTGQNGDAARGGPYDRSVHWGGNVSELPVPSATRLKSPSWLDGRLVIGVVLVLLSVVVGAKIIASSQRYDVMWAASRDIAPGTTLIKADLLQVDVRFKDHGALYISAAGASPVGRVTVAPLADGQLIPMAAVPAT